MLKAINDWITEILKSSKIAAANDARAAAA